MRGIKNSDLAATTLLVIASICCVVLAFGSGLESGARSSDVGRNTVSRSSGKTTQAQVGSTLEEPGAGAVVRAGLVIGDFTGDGIVALDDWAAFVECMGGPVGPPVLPTQAWVRMCLDAFDFDSSVTIDLNDATELILLVCAGGCPVCGNGVIDAGETCDDGNTVGGDGCSATCQLETGVCGDGIIDAGTEECDDGNTISGDGCDANCMIERPANNDCADATVITDGDTFFDSLNATTDGPDEPSACDFSGSTQVEADIWFSYDATCTGEVVASLCGSGFDTKMAVYDGCTCLPAGDSAITCSDDDCGAGLFASRVSFSAARDQCYLIRVGGFNVSQGPGVLAVRCDAPPVCQATTGDCFAGHGTPGCADEACCTITCQADPFCCDAVWDAQCASEAQGLCTGSFPACSSATGGCDADNAAPGCSDTTCCNTVCAADPFCCIARWDRFCAEEAAGICGLNCGTAPPFGSNNDCDQLPTTANSPQPGCADAVTCQNVCTLAPTCCLDDWTMLCVCLANPADPCCAAVCGADPFCCSDQWDDLCDSEAATLCP